MGAMKLCLLLFCLFLASPGVSSVRKLNNIDDLINTNYGKHTPRHGLQLLFWFAQEVNVDQNSNEILLNFDLRNGTYGFHQFGNREGILPALESGQRYYEVGNLNSQRYCGVNELPFYVQMNYVNHRNLQESNMDRLIVSLDENSTNRIRRVFITAHNLGSNDFNSADTYEIVPALLSQIRQDYPCRNNQNKDVRQFLKNINYDSCGSMKHRKRSADTQCNTYEGIKLEIKTATDGSIELKYNNIPAKYKYVYIEICQNTHSSVNNEDPTMVGKYQISDLSGALSTNVLLNAGLQPRLQLYSYYFGTPVTWYGPEFDGANRVIPIRIKGSDASLQLWAKDGKACARLYIKKTFKNWKDVFYNSWVGFYKSSQHENNKYDKYKYAIEFELIDSTTREDYDIYQHDFSLTIAPGVQIRFLLDKIYDKVLAQTTPWESGEMTSTCDKGNHQPDPSSTWSFPEFFYEPGYYDANSVIPTKILGYDAGLQLFTQDGKACARLYIKKTFKDWKDTFYYSWVGFYTSSQNTNKGYKIYEYVMKFEKMEGGTKNFDIYQYKSKLTIASGVQIRFLKDSGYDEKLAETKPWS